MAGTDEVRIDSRRVGWRLVDGHALVVCRASGGLHRLDRAGTRIWLALAAPVPDTAEVALFLRDLEQAGLVEGTAASAGHSAPVRPSPSPQAHRPQQRRIDQAWVLTEEIAPSPAALARGVGAGYLLSSPLGGLSLLTGDAAVLWRLLASRPRTYVALLDGLCAQAGSTYDEVEPRLASLLSSWIAGGAVRGLERVEHLPAFWNARGAASSVRPAGARRLGTLDGLGASASPERPDDGLRLGAAATLRDGAAAVRHVAIVCQYGIRGFAPGIEPYTQRSIERLRRLDVDLVILAGGGRHGSSALREAESVIEKYLEQLPGPALWVEKHSTTTWQNVEYSLELLAARGIVPRRVSLLGDRTRAEKLRLACAIARRRFALRAVEFRVIPIERPRFTWRDTRVLQWLAGTAQLLGETGRRRRVPIPGAPESTST